MFLKFYLIYKPVSVFLGFSSKIILCMKCSHKSLNCTTIITDNSPACCSLLILLIFCLSAGTKEVNATGKSFTVRSSLQFQVDRRDDGVAYTCSVEHVSLSNPYMTTEVLEVHCEYSHTYPKAGLYVRLVLRRNTRIEITFVSAGLVLHLLRISAGLGFR